MLDQCAPGWQCEQTEHVYRILWNGRTYPSFPKARQVDVGHIRKMIRHLGIDKTCAQAHLEILR